MAVAVRIFHALPPRSAGRLERFLATARQSVAERHAETFRALGIPDVEVVATRPDGTSFGSRVRSSLPKIGGLVVLGAGAVPLATRSDLAAFAAAARSVDKVALTNNRYSADIVAVANASRLGGLPDLPTDNALPRWLEEVAGYAVADLSRRWRLQVDYDSPLDVHLAGGCDEAELADASGVDLRPAADRQVAVSRVAGDSHAEVLVAGRTSATSLRWLERHVPARVRALVEERGLRASSPLASSRGGSQRPPRSILGRALDAEGPAALGAIVADLADGALIDTRVLLAHRLGADESRWPRAEDRYASDLLMPERIHDPWLRALTESAASAPIPVALGGHTLVGPGLRLALGVRS